MFGEKLLVRSSSITNQKIKG